MPFRTFEAMWNGIFAGEITANIELVRSLRTRPGLKVGLLSNTNTLHYEYLRRRMPILSEFSYIYVSHEMGCRKPEAACYRYVLRKMEVRPQRAVFVDDYPENIAAAREVGMRCIHATGPAAVRAGLAELGLV